MDVQTLESLFFALSNLKEHCEFADFAVKDVWVNRRFHEKMIEYLNELAEHQERMNLQRHNGGYGKKKSANEASEIYGETRSRVFKGLSA